MNIMKIINMVFSIGCALFMNSLNCCMPDGEVRHILAGVFLGAGAVACMNLLGEKWEDAK